MKTFTAEEIDQHVETHREILAFIESKLPATRSFFQREYKPSGVTIDNDGDITAKYFRYAGCGEYDYEHIPLHMYKLLQDA